MLYINRWFMRGSHLSKQCVIKAMSIAVDILQDSDSPAAFLERVI